MDKICRQVIRLAFHEDFGKRDITSAALVYRRKTTADVIAKAPGIISGTDAFAYVYRLVLPRVRVRFLVKDGQRVRSGQKIARLVGPAWALLAGERLALNLLGRLSGVATTTAAFVERVRGTNAKILDTRKTTPGLRWLEKKAVRDGGGHNHRFGLWDMVLIKDNHIAAARGLLPAWEGVRGIKAKKEIEVTNLRQLRQAAQFGPDIIMLDNFDLPQMRKAVRFIRTFYPRIKIEASGGVNLDNVKKIADTGVDFISVGALTHSAKALDISIEFKQ